ncbi:hypothetical protein AUEXF2481DRAFT_3197 [Aureobasidium subglaciale EXF-2481]|uniref:BRCT domain-containing protein n=1 Tax=Aureobasidium subglaciale (strain EXF-2481) TaxID=1043005 RepID=A0A074YTC1_AURSE|nr:uncharacterized protein AUEXF2481DRAFT_3197 [Aureobasidium subglaciale EXF-2481]KAI5205903.1 hypothetical protein E4T38_04086 [Aureobasidium subglaciale]KAI5224796.1 hypothetical protein E4T40_03861 [Aureobasidium subglaciale]KAI5228000.1 hypothetical protein E4T41_04081 [Aureobasidium subglaciale]KAI5263518.1 hypothetical protein E4T46_03702 [Aureobasidium subglaciale]KEQ97377.1 hypothetical protein AUEXF2481DRAFT_3197 [Aureobasidium subglaciale EXF-2481]
MPPKKLEAREHNVFLTTSVTFDNKKDDFGRLQVYQAFSSLDEANEFCAAKADELALSLDIVAPEPTLKHYTNDGTFRMELPLEHRNRDVIVETIIMPLMGGIILHNKSMSRKTKSVTKSSKALPKPKRQKARPAPSSDESTEEEDDDQDVDMDSAPASPKSMKAMKRASIKLENQDSTTDHPDAVNLEHRDSVIQPIIDPTEVTEADVAAAPSGRPDCLRMSSYFITGTHPHWSYEQLEIIIRIFGGEVKKKLPTYNLDAMFTVVLGAKVPAAALRRIKTKEFSTITPQEVITRIRYSDTPTDPTRIASEKVAKLCKMVAAKPIPARRMVQDEDEADSDVQEPATKRKSVKYEDETDSD